MQAAEREQNNRHNWNNENIRLAKRDLVFRHWYDIFALFLSFIIIIIFVLATIWLVFKGYNVAGTCFAGGSIAMIIYALLGKKKAEK